MTDNRQSECEKTFRIYLEVIDKVMGATEPKFVGTSQAIKSEFKQKWIKNMKDDLESYTQEDVDEEPEPKADDKPAQLEAVKVVKPEKEEAKEEEKKVEEEVKEKAEENKSEESLAPPDPKKAKVAEDEEVLSDAGSDLDDLIKNEDDEKDPDCVITGVTTGCKTNRGKWKGDILNCVLQRKGYPETLYSKCSCVFDQGFKK